MTKDKPTQRDIETLTKETLVPFLQDIFIECGGEEYLGESVTMAEHMLQAATLAEQDGQTEDIIIAALLHDIGHFIGELGAFSIDDTTDRYHEEAGAKLLERFFPKIVADCVRHHVAAKRYLCATDPTYLQQLSAASIHSLNLQGGPMDVEEAASFANNPNLNAIIAVRRFDDAGKCPGLQTKDFDYFAPMAERIVDAHLRK